MREIEFRFSTKLSTQPILKCSYYFVKHKSYSIDFEVFIILKKGYEQFAIRSLKTLKSFRFMVVYIVFS